MPIYRAKITYIFTGTIDIEAVDEIDTEDKIGRLNVQLDINLYHIKDTTFNYMPPTSERILVINKIKD